MVRSSSAAARMEEMLRRDLNTTKASLIQRTEQLCVLCLWTVQRPSTACLPCCTAQVCFERLE